jgi:cob(I)alamin adenosyltransferase
MNSGKNKSENLSIYNNWFKKVWTQKSSSQLPGLSRLEFGLVQVYTGNGKGKTTAALGQALRASGHHVKSLIIQFLKGGSYTGEYEAINYCLPLIKIIQTGRRFFINKEKISQKDIDLNRKGFATALDIATVDNDISLIILDEINVAVWLGIIDIKEVLYLIKNKRKNLELILTGRNAPQEIINAADLVTEMKEIKHYFSKNIPSRIGIEM